MCSSPNEDHVHRKRLIVGTALLVAFMILCLSGSAVAWNEWKNRRGYVGYHEPLPGFAYCSSRQIKPCIVSISLNSSGGMVIDILVNNSLPDFYLKIRDEADEHFYDCQKTSWYSIHVSCTGEAMPVGKTLSFSLVSTRGSVTLAEGSFPIIGMALATPEIYFTPTPLSPFDRPPRQPIE